MNENESFFFRAVQTRFRARYKRLFPAGTAGACAAEAAAVLHGDIFPEKAGHQLKT